MKQVLHLCSKIRGLFSASQCSDVGYDCRLTVVRPSIDCRSAMLKLCSVLAILLTIGVGNVWGTDVVFTFNTTAGLTELGITEPSKNSTTEITSDISKSVITITPAKNNASSKPVVRKSNDATPTMDLRLYKRSSGTKGASITIRVSGDNKLTGISGLWTSKVAATTGTLSSGSWTPTKNSTTTEVEIYNNSTASSGTASGCTVITVSYESTVSCTSITPSLSYASVGGTTLVVGSTSSGSPTVSGNTGSGAVTYSVTAASPAGCATVNSSTGVVTAVAAGTATITASIAANGGYCSGSATANFTITVPAYTVSFSTGTGNPSQDDITEASGGAGITLPAGPTPRCSGDGWSFAGWKETSAVTSETTVAPTLLSAGSTFHPTGNVTLYAVYQKADLSTNYAKITSSAALTSGSNYVIARGTSLALDASDYYMDDGDGYFGTTSISVSDNTISNPNADLIWEISGNNTDGYSFYNANQNLYIGYSTSNHDLYADGTKHSDYTITYTSSNFYVKSKAESSYYFATWEYGLSGGGSAYFFEIDNSSAYVVLYKQSGTITYFSNPTCCTPLGSINGSFF